MKKTLLVSWPSLYPYTRSAVAKRSKNVKVIIMKLFEFHKNREIHIMNVLRCHAIRMYGKIWISWDKKKKLKMEEKINLKIIQVEVFFLERPESWRKYVRQASCQALKETRCCFSIHTGSPSITSHSHQTTLDCEKVISIVFVIFISKTISSGVIIIKERESWWGDEINQQQYASRLWFCPRGIFPSILEH